MFWEGLEDTTTLIPSLWCTSLPDSTIHLLFQQCCFKNFTSLLPKTALLSPGQQLPGNEVEFHLAFFRSTEGQWHQCPDVALVWYLYHSEPVQALTTTQSNRGHCCAAIWPWPYLGTVRWRQFTDMQYVRTWHTVCICMSMLCSYARTRYLFPYDYR